MHESTDAVVDQPRTSRNDLWGMLIVAAMAFIMFIVPMWRDAFARLAAGEAIVPVTDLPGTTLPADTVATATVERVDLVVPLSEQSAVVASLLVTADLLTPALWTGVLVLTVLLARDSLRGHLFSRRFAVLWGWLTSAAAAVALVPTAARFMGGNGVLAGLGWDEARPDVASDSWVVLVLVAAYVLVIVLQRAGRRLADDQAGTV